MSKRVEIVQEVTYDLKKPIPQYPLLKWKELRDGLRKVKMEDYIPEELCFFAVFRKFIMDGSITGYEMYTDNESYSQLFYSYTEKELHSYLRVIMWNRLHYEHLSQRKEKEIIKDFYRKIDNEIQNFNTFLLKEGLIIKVQNIRNADDITYVVSDKGMSFTTKKAYKKIPLAEGQKLLTEVIQKAEEFNTSDGPHWYIDTLYLFGSVLKGKDMVGDIDLIMKVSSRPEYKDDSWRELEIKRAQTLGYKPDRYGIYSTQEEPLKHLKISRYLSITERLELKVLEEKGEPYKLVYSREAD